MFSRIGFFYFNLSISIFLNVYFQKHLIKTDSLPLPSPILTELSSAETLYSSEEKVS